MDPYEPWLLSRWTFSTLLDVINHYNDFKRLNLTDQEKKDLVEYLKSL